MPQLGFDVYIFTNAGNFLK